MSPRGVNGHVFVAFLIGFIGFCFTQQPELINDLLGVNVGDSSSPQRAVRHSSRAIPGRRGSSNGQQRALGRVR